MYSGTAMTAAIAVSLMVIERIEPKAGSMRTMACGRMISATACRRDMPMVAAAPRAWGRGERGVGRRPPGMGRVGGGAQPFEERRLGRVDREADRLCLLGAGLAIILVRQRCQALDLTRHGDPGDPVDRRGI